MVQAHDKLVMGHMQGKGRKVVNLLSASGAKSKDEVFDNFICNLFSSKLDLSYSMKKSLADGSTMITNNMSMTLPLDQSLLISTAKK